MAPDTWFADYCHIALAWLRGWRSRRHGWTTYDPLAEDQATAAWWNQTPEDTTDDE